MNKKGYAGRRYVERVREDTQRYARAMLAENSQLKLRLLAVEEERRLLREELDRSQRDWARLREEMTQIEDEGRRHWEQYAYVEHQNSNLASLYVASYRLHTTLDRPTLITTIFEILSNLVGSEEAAIFEMEEGGGALSLVGWNGIDPAPYRRVPLDSGAIGEAARRGETWVASLEQTGSEGSLTACVPLRLEDRVTGAIAIFRLLPQKPGLQDLDHELFDLLAEQAATALYCTTLHAARVRAAEVEA